MCEHVKSGATNMFLMEHHMAMKTLFPKYNFYTRVQEISFRRSVDHKDWARSSSPFILLHIY